MMLENSIDGFIYKPQSLKNKAVIVGGGSTGVGRSTALLLAAHGARVVIFGRHEQALKEATNDINKVGTVYAIQTDQSRHESVVSTFSRAYKLLGGLNILINAAGIGGGTITTTEFGDIEYIIKTNLLGLMDCCREAIPLMKKSGGHIVNIGSIIGYTREANTDIYTATKSALQGFTESLRKQINYENIKVTLVEPGLISTDMSYIQPSQQPKMKKDMTVLNTEEVAMAIYYAVTQPIGTEVINIQVRPHHQSNI